MNGPKGWPIVAVILACGVVSARADDYKARRIGDWFTHAEEDRFGDDDGGNFVALTRENGTGFVFAVRCLSKTLTIALMPKTRLLKQGEEYSIKVRVDKNPIVETTGFAVTSEMIELDTEKALVKQVREGRETAIRLESIMGRIVSTHIFKTDGAPKAFADLSKECPLD